MQTIGLPHCTAPCPILLLLSTRLDSDIFNTLTKSEPAVQNQDSNPIAGYTGSQFPTHSAILSLISQTFLGTTLNS